MLDPTEITLLLFLIKERITKVDDNSFEYATLISVEQTLADMLEQALERTH